MKTQTHFFSCRKYINLFPVLFAVLFVVSACQAKEQKTEKFEPLFDGLKSGRYNSSDGCITIGNVSILLDMKDFEQELGFYSDANCKSGKVVFPKAISVETQAAGIWNGYAVFDEGTDVNSRDLRLIQINHPHVSHTLSYELRPVFKSKKINYFSPIDKEIKPTDCPPEQKAELKEWQRMHLGMGLAQEMVFDLQTGKSVATGAVKCFAMQ